MNEVEQTFSQFIKNWKAFPDEPVIDQKPQIVERRLSVVSHNTWRVLGSGGSPSFVSLNREEGSQGTFHSSGALKILGFPLHPLIGLVFKLEYRVEFTKASTGIKEQRDFVLGWCLYVPQITQNELLHEGEVQLDLILGPGLTLFGEVLWDQTQVRKDRQKLFVKMAFVLSGSEENQSGKSLSAEERRLQQDLMLSQASEQIQKQVKESVEADK